MPRLDEVTTSKRSHPSEKSGSLCFAAYALVSVLVLNDSSATKSTVVTLPHTSALRGPERSNATKHAGLYGFRSGSTRTAREAAGSMSPCEGAPTSFLGRAFTPDRSTLASGSALPPLALRTEMSCTSDSLTSKNRLRSWYVYLAHRVPSCVSASFKYSLNAFAVFRRSLDASTKVVGEAALCGGLGDLFFFARREPGLRMCARALCVRGNWPCPAGPQTSRTDSFRGMSCGQHLSFAREESAV